MILEAAQQAVHVDFNGYSIVLLRDVTAGGLLAHACLFMLKIDCYSKADEGFPTFPNTEVFTSDDPCFVVEVVFVWYLDDFPKFVII